MMAQLTHIINELEKLIPQARRKYKKYVDGGTMTPYTRDHKLNVLETILKCAKDAATKQTTLTEQFKKLHDGNELGTDKKSN